MIVRRAVIYGFGRLINCEFEPDKKGILNVTKGLAEDNDLFFEFIRTMLYGHTFKNGKSTREIYRPEETFDARGKKVIYGGELVYDACGRTYKLSCFWGVKKENDSFRITDTVTGRDVRIDLGMTVGEKTLRISEGAFVSAAKDFGLCKEDKEGGKFFLGRLSCLLSAFDKRPSPLEIRSKLSEKLKELTDPKTKKGAFDKLVIKKMSLKNNLARIGDRDIKLKKLRAELEKTKDSLSATESEISEQKRLYGLCAAANTLLEKDRIMAVYDRQASLMRQLDRIEAEHGMKTGSNIIKSAVLPVLLLAAGAVLIGLGAGSVFKRIPGYYFEIFGAVPAAAGILLLIRTLYKFSVRSFVKTSGGTVPYDEESLRIKTEIYKTNDELIGLLGDCSAEEILSKWRESEDLMRNAGDSERRFAVMQKSYDLKEALEALDRKKRPLETRLDELKADINRIYSAGGKSFSETVFELDGIDETINKLSDEIESVKTAVKCAEAAEERFKKEVVAPALANAGSIYFKTIGDSAEFMIDEDYGIYAICSDKELAALSLRGALSEIASAESDRQLMFINDKAGEKPYLERFMRASGIGQLVVVSQK